MTMDDELERYGLQWVAPETPVSVPMPDGYWTPWHVAQERIERLQRDKSELVHQHNALMKAVRAEQERAEKAERERDEARAERDAFWDALTEVEAVLRNDLYKNRVANALAIIDEARHMDRDALRAALGGEG